MRRVDDATAREALGKFSKDGDHTTAMLVLHLLADRADDMAEIERLKEEVEKIKKGGE